MDGEENLQTRLVHCPRIIKSCQAQYLQDAKELGVHLVDFDSDFNTFQPAQQLEGGSQQPPASACSKLSALQPAKRGEGGAEELRAYQSRFFEEDGALQTPSSSWRGESDEAPNCEAGSTAGRNPAGAGGKKRRKRGRGGTKPVYRAQRGLGGFADKWAHREFRLKKRAMEKEKAYQADLSLRLDGSRTSTGWHDVQGVDTTLTDPQVMTAPALGELFGGRNLGDKFELFPQEHPCDKYCEWFGSKSLKEN